LYGTGKFGLSFELFPPKSAESEVAMWQTVEDLMAFSPSLVTCTYGAGGSTRGKTLDIVEGVHRKYGLPVASHLTCVGSSVDELREYLAEALDRGISGIVALRGDPPKGETEFRPVVGGLSYASELVQLIHTECPSLDIAVAGYPETHQEAMSEEMDLENLKRKCDAGGQAVITQLFYENSDLFRFRDRCESLGIHTPIVPGVMPVVNFSQVRRIAKLCKAKLPAEFINAMEKAGESESAQFEAGVQFATQQVHELVRAGVPGLHFYVLNRSPATAQVLQQVGISGKN
jgi:methylenetetrahydrofolate reductase (NADPH)